MENTEKASLNFIEEIIEEHINSGKYTSSQIYTRFPPEPNGYLHIGHAKSICLNFGLGKKYGGKTNLRFDDTNPETEKTDYVESIQRDVYWLLSGGGFAAPYPWAELRYASDYMQQLYDWAVLLIKKGLAYVDFSTAEEMDKMKKMGQNSPYRDTTPEENLRLFEEMKSGKYTDGHCVLRAKIDMSADNRQLRDPLLYRIKHAHHHRTGDAWCIYPMYDWAHGQSDYLEGITHSICTLEFEDHNALYQWCLRNLDLPNYLPQQIEFSRMNVNYMITSKRKLKQLIEENHVRDWDDPRMPTVSGMRRRGFTPQAIRNFVDKAGTSKRPQHIDVSALEFSVREHLNALSKRIMAVLDPVKVVISNYPDSVEYMEVENNPENEADGSRKVPFSREIYIEREDFMLNPPKKYFRLAPGQMVRLKGAYIVQCDGYDTDANGNVTQINCSYLPNSRSGADTSGIKVKGTIHWVSVAHAHKAEVRLYDRLFSNPSPDTQKDEEGKDIDFKTFLNPNSLEVVTGYVEPFLDDFSAVEKYFALMHDADFRKMDDAAALFNNHFQFIRKGYFCLDADSTASKWVFNRTITLKDTWAKEQDKE